MKDVLKLIMLLVVGLLTAIIIYPALHEIGHFLAAIICDGYIEDVKLLPMPSVLCRIDEVNTATIIFIGFGGVALPYLLTAFPEPDDFWMWYIWLLIKGITLFSLVISGIAIFMFFTGKPMIGEDMTQILYYASEYAVLYVLGLLVLGIISVLQIIKVHPLKRCYKEFKL